MAEQTLSQYITELETELAKYKSDPRTEAFAVYKNILDQQVAYLKSFKIKEEIVKLAKEDATYARAKDMWKELPDMIREMGALSTELKINEEKKDEKLVMSTPQSIARGDV